MLPAYEKGANMKKPLIVILCLFGLFVKNHGLFVQHENFDNSDVDICERISSKSDVNLEKIGGKWYGEEIYIHDGVSVGALKDVCVVVDILTESLHNETTTSLMRHHHLQTSWRENGSSIQYMSSYHISKPGFWLPLAHKKKSNHRLFTGNVVVSQATVDHMVLTFCEGDPRRRLVSIVVSKKPNTLTKTDFEDARCMLKGRGLKISSVHEICESGDSGVPAVMLPIPTLIFVIIFSFNWNKFQY